MPSALLVEMQKTPAALSAVGAFWQRMTTVQWSGDADLAMVLRASGDYYRTLGVSPLRGRLIEPADDAGTGQVAVLGYDFWIRRFGADPDVLGKTLIVEGIPRTIVGITPRWFSGTDRSTARWRT